MRIQAVAALILGIGLGVLLGRIPAAAVTVAAVQSRACGWLPELDAVRAAPKNHKVLLENDRVRVLDVTVAPGEREPVHAHCWPSVMYVMQEGIYRDFDAQGKLVDEVRTPPPASKYPMTLWLEPQAPHAVHNLDKKPTRLLRIELKR